MYLSFLLAIQCTLVFTSFAIIDIIDLRTFHNYEHPNSLGVRIFEVLLYFSFSSDLLCCSALVSAMTPVSLGSLALKLQIWVRPANYMLLWEWKCLSLEIEHGIHCFQLKTYISWCQACIFKFPNNLVLGIFIARTYVYHNTVNKNFFFMTTLDAYIIFIWVITNVRKVTVTSTTLPSPWRPYGVHCHAGQKYLVHILCF